VLALAATLLVAALVAAPARAQDATSQAPGTQAPADPAPPATPSAPMVPDPTPPTAPTSAPTAPTSAPSDQPAQPPDQPAATDTTTPTDPAPADTGTGSPQSTDDHAASRQPTHSGDASSGAGQGTVVPAPAVSSTGVSTMAQTVDTVAPSSDGYPGAWTGQDTFVLDRAKHRVAGAAAALGGSRGPLSRLLVLHAVSRAGSLVVKARRDHDVAQVKPIGGPPGSGNQLPDQNPFFNLLSGPGGSAAGLALAGVLAILGAALILPRDRSRRFRMPTVTWRPLAYVPPIELPG
jgi:hypothetical protein